MIFKVGTHVKWAEITEPYTLLASITYTSLTKIPCTLCKHFNEFLQQPGIKRFVSKYLSNQNFSHTRNVIKWFKMQCAHTHRIGMDMRTAQTRRVWRWLCELQRHSVCPAASGGAAIQGTLLTIRSSLGSYNPRYFVLARVLYVKCVVYFILYTGFACYSLLPCVAGTAAGATLATPPGCHWGGPCLSPARRALRPSSQTLQRHERILYLR